ncbi:MAG: helix-turn-helix domain-containing protein [Chitinophagaceae bacterium]
MRLYIKNMVCSRCKMVVKDELIKFGVHPTAVELGEVSITEELNNKNKDELNKIFQSFGFELIDDRKSQLIEKIKNTIVELVHYSENQLETNFSEHISKKLHHDYNYLSNLFSEVEGTTIEKYLIAQKIERVKELLKYDELSLSEIADRLGYSSVAYLSNQFKKVTGLTPSYFKQPGENKRKPLDKI